MNNKSQRLEQLIGFHEANPNDPFLVFALAKEYEKLDDYTNALLHYDSIVSQNPDYVGVYYHLASLRAELGEREVALAVCKQGITQCEEANDHHALAELKNLMLNIEYD